MKKQLTNGSAARARGSGERLMLLCAPLLPAAIVAGAVLPGVRWSGPVALATMLCGASLCILLAQTLAGRARHRRLAALADAMDQAFVPAAGPGRSGALVDRLAEAAARLIERSRALDHRLAQSHGVTGLPTREPLLEAMEASRGGGLLGVVELTDFDRLCAMDLAVANQVIVEMAERMRRMVGPSRSLAHVDRARFAVWYDQDALDSASTEFDALCYALRDRIVVDGLAMLPQIRSASLYQAQNMCEAGPLLARVIAGLAGVETQPDANPVAHRAIEAARHSFAFEQDLREAVAKNQLELRFQPFIDAAHQSVCGAEALLRWRHPEQGLVSPTSFVPVMETAGLAEEIGLWTLDAGCREARNWENEGLGGLKVAINLSAHQLKRQDIDRMVERTMKRHRLRPALLELELTETAAAIDPANAKRLFDKLRALGIAISIDDFGAGYSSLSYLKKLRFDKLKIDREFVADVDRQRDSQAICQSIIALGRGLGIAILAEGVERFEEYHWLRTHGCHLFQGFYFSRPLEPAAFRAFVQDRAAIAALTDLSPHALQERLTMSL